MIDWNRRRREARDLLDRVGSDIDPDRLVESLSMPEQQIVEIAKAIGSAARVVIMDEPTASLSEREVARLFAIVSRLKAQGVGVIYISHRLEEILSIADRVTVLRDGRTVSTQRELVCSDRPDQSDDRREVSSIYPKRTVSHGEVALDLRHIWCRAAGVHDVSLECAAARSWGCRGSSGRAAPSWHERCSPDPARLGRYSCLVGPSTFDLRRVPSRRGLDICRKIARATASFQK